MNYDKEWMGFDALRHRVYHLNRTLQHWEGDGEPTKSHELEERLKIVQHTITSYLRPDFRYAQRISEVIGGRV